MLEIFLALNGGECGIEDFEVHKTINVKALRMSWDQLVPMFVNPTHEITCDTNVECPPRSAGKDVDVELLHVPPGSIVGDAVPYYRDGRVKPGHDGLSGEFRLLPLGR
jgi:hypothetical protein